MLDIDFAEKSFEDQVNSLSDLEIKQLVRLVIARCNDNTDMDPEFAKCFEFWNKVISDQRPFAKGDIDYTMDFFFQKLGIESLGKDSDFSRYVARFSDANPRQVASLMKKMTNILSNVEKMDEEWQENFFTSFPPPSQDLNCLDGTLERIEIIERDLTSVEALQPYLQAHFLAISNLTEFLKPDVYKGNQVHIPKYLEYSLEISDEKSIHPQSDIPFTKSVIAHQRYGELFKEFLFKKIAAAVGERRDEIGQAIAAVNDMMQDQPVDQWFVEIKQALKPFNEKDINFFQEDEQEDGRYKISDEAIDEMVHNHPAVQFLSSAEANAVFLNSRVVVQEQDSEVAEYGVQQRQFRDSLSGNAAAFFSYEGCVALSNLLSPKHNYPSINDDQIFAIEHLWMAGQKLISMPHFLFVTVLDQLTHENKDFLENMSEKLSQFFPTSGKRIEEIKEQYQNLSQHIVFRGDRMNLDLWPMIYRGFPTVDIVNKIEKVGSDEGDVSPELVKGLDFNHPRAVISYLSWWEHLIRRSDAVDILGAIKSNMQENPVQEICVKYALMAASKTDEVDKCVLLLEDFANYEPRYFQDSTFFINIAARNSVELLEKTKGLMEKHPQFLQQNFEGQDAIDSAVSHGSIAVLKKYLKVLQPSESKCFGLCVLAIAENQLKSFSELLNFSPRVMLYHDRQENNLIHYAASYGREAFIMELMNFTNEARVDKNFGIRLKQEVNRRNTSGQTPIYLAAQKDNIDEVMILFSRLGADPFIRDNNQTNAAEVALLNRKKNVVKFFVENKIYRESAIAGGGVILELARRTKFDEAEFLLQCGEDINYPNPNRNNNADLHNAVLEGRSDLVRFLINHGADVAQPNRENLNPFQIAVAIQNGKVLMEFSRSFIDLFEKRDIEAMKNLVRAGLNPNFVNNAGDSLPHIFVKNLINISHDDNYNDAAYNFIKGFSEIGIDMNIQNSEGFTTDYLIAQSNHNNILNSIPTARFDALFVVAIERADTDMINSLFEFAESRTMGENAVDVQNIFSEKFDHYFSHAERINAGEDLKKLLLEKNDQLKARLVSAEDDISQKSFASEVSQGEKSNEISRVNSPDLESENLPSPPSTTLVTSSSNPMVVKVPSNDNSK